MRLQNGRFPNRESWGVSACTILTAKELLIQLQVGLTPLSFHDLF